MPASASACIVVKIGSAVLAPDGSLSEPMVEALASDIAHAAAQGPHRMIVVSSGAIASGFTALGLSKPPKTIILKQAAAAVGQSRLMRAWSQAFARHDVHVAQVLLTGEDLDHRTRHINARQTLRTLIERRIVPIINENDSVSFAEIKLGDNDRLSALVAGLVEAQRLIILSSARGLYEHGDPRRIISVVTDLALAGAHITGATSAVGTGGMSTKLDAVRTAAAAGVPSVIASGTEPAVVSRLLAGERIGTSFPVRSRRMGARKRWIGFATRARGVIRVDDGAARAIIQRGASLLASGITGVEGDFQPGAIVDLRLARGSPFARGRASYAGHEIRAIAGRRTAQIASILGYVYRDEVIHRDDLVLLREEPGS